MMKLRSLVLVLGTLILCAPSFSQAANLNVYSGTVSYNISGGFLAPFGDFGNYFTPGPGGAFSVNYSPGEDSFLYFPGLPRYYLSSSVSYARFEVDGSPLSSLDLVVIDAGPVFFMPLFRYLVPFAGLSAGVFFERIHLDELDRLENRAGPAVLAHAGVTFPITPSLSISAEGLYRFCYLHNSSLQTAGAFLSFSYNFSGDYGNRIGLSESSVKIIRRETSDIFAIRFTEYNADGIGIMTIRNDGESTVYNITVEIAIDGVTETAKSTDEIDSLIPGEVRRFRIPVALSASILRQSSDRESQLRCTVIYSTGDTRYHTTETAGIPVFGRNAIMWDETARLGSFIMPRNESVTRFARKAIAAAEGEKSPGIPRALRDAVILFDSLHAGGFTYVSDPSSGYSVISAKRNAVDYVQLPAETLNRKSGDCDDLTALYTSMLESVGIASAVATLPGHIFVLFNTKIPASMYFRVAADSELLVIRDDTVWVPVEITSLKTPFMEAWKTAAAEVRSAGFEMLETVELWEKYPSSDGGDTRSATTPDTAKLVKAVRSDYDSILEGSIGRKGAALVAATKADPADYRSWGQLGALYGVFGMLDGAEQALDRCLSIKPDYAPALVNKGNIRMLRRDYESAASLYKKAVEINPGNYSAYLNLALLSRERKNFNDARKYYDKAEGINPLASMKYKYLTRGNKSGKN